MIIYEVFRKFYPHNGETFVLAIFTHPQGFILRIYKDKTPIHWILGGPGYEEYEDWMTFGPVNPFEDLIESAEEWIAENFTEPVPA